MYYNNYEDYMRNVLGYSNMNNNTYQQYDSNYSNYNNYNNMQMNQFQIRNDVTDIEKMYPEIYRIINPMVCKMCDNNNQPISESLIEQMTNEIYDNVVNRVEIQNVINLNVNTRESEESECDDCNRSSEPNRSYVTNKNASGNLNKNNNCTNNISSSNIANNSNSNNSNSINNSNNNSNNCNCTHSNTNSQNNSSRQSNTLVSDSMCNSQTIVENITENRSPVQGSARRRNNLLRDLIRILILNQLFRPNRPNRPPYRPQPPRPRGPMFDVPNMNFGQPVQSMVMPPFDFS